MGSFTTAKFEMYYKWGDNQSTIRMMEDFDSVLAALIALYNKDNKDFAIKCKNAGSDKTKWPDAPITAIDKLYAIWDEIFPQRRLKEDDSKFYAMLPNDNTAQQKYSGTQMSDGERAVLYMVAQVLCVPDNKIMIIDEPEIHLHRSIMNRLWHTLERYRPDCLFIYITHDIQFAAAHGKVDKIWIKAFDGKKWIFEKIMDEDLPEELTLEILGSRKKVLFVEGEKSSYDYQLYTELYSDFLIIPCGGCSQVIARTKSFRNSTNLHDCTVYGLIDRDYRSNHEVETLKNNGIYVLDVAEVENLFLVEELIQMMAARFGVPNVEKAVSDVKDFVINTKFKYMIERQICQSVVAEIKYQISCIEIENKNEADAKLTLKTGLHAISFDDIRTQKEPLFRDPLDKQDYRAVLKVFNEKGIAATVGDKLGVDKRKYQEKVINLLRGDCHDKIVDALSSYLPRELPR